MIKLAGTLNLAEALEKSSIQQIVSWEARNSELLKNVFALYSEKTNRHIENFCCIVDLKGFTMSQVTGDVWKLLKLSNTTTADNYPESLGVFLILNAPWVFVTVWRIIKTFVDPRTIKSLRFLVPIFSQFFMSMWTPIIYPSNMVGMESMGLKIWQNLKRMLAINFSKSLRLLLQRVRRKRSDMISGCCLNLQDGACLYGNTLYVFVN